MGALPGTLGGQLWGEGTIEPPSHGSPAIQSRFEVPRSKECRAVTQRGPWGDADHFSKAMPRMRRSRSASFGLPPIGSGTRSSRGHFGLERQDQPPVFDALQKDAGGAGSTCGSS